MIITLNNSSIVIARIIDVINTICEYFKNRKNPKTNKITASMKAKTEFASLCGTNVTPHLQFTGNNSPANNFLNRENFPVLQFGQLLDFIITLF